LKRGGIINVVELALRALGTAGMRERLPLTCDILLIHECRAKMTDMLERLVVREQSQKAAKLRPAIGAACGRKIGLSSW
jgi:hypothetical protein